MQVVESRHRHLRPRHLPQSRPRASRSFSDAVRPARAAGGRGRSSQARPSNCGEQRASIRRASRSARFENSNFTSAPAESSRTRTRRLRRPSRNPRAPSSIDCSSAARSSASISPSLTGTTCKSVPSGRSVGSSAMMRPFSTWALSTVIEASLSLQLRKRCSARDRVVSCMRAATPTPQPHPISLPFRVVTSPRRPQRVPARGRRWGQVGAPLGATDGGTTNGRGGRIRTDDPQTPRWGEEAETPGNWAL